MDDIEQVFPSAELARSATVQVKQSGMLTALQHITPHTPPLQFCPLATFKLSI